MRIEYEVTFPDFIEAQSVHSHYRMWPVFIPLILLGDFFLIQPLPWARTAYGTISRLLPGFGGPLYAAGGIVLLAVGGWWLSRTPQIGKTPPWRRHETPNRRRVMRAAILLLLLASSAFFAVQRFQFERSGAVRPGDSLTFYGSPIGERGILDILMQILPGGAMILFGLAIILAEPFLVRLRYRQNWIGEKPLTVDVDARGCVFSTSFAKSEFLWDAFPGYVESENLFLLYISRTRFIPIPKRAFVDIGDLHPFRELLRQNVSELQIAFPVVVQPAAQKSNQKSSETSAPTAPSVESAHRYDGHAEHDQNKGDKGDGIIYF
jgi:hypothetical protein